jgi:hypothetical protein
VDWIKGVTIWGRAVTGARFDGANYECPVEADWGVNHIACTDAQANSSSAARTNCGSWNSSATCPSGTLASAVQVHTSSDHEIVGLALKCRTVAFEQPE